MKGGVIIWRETGLSGWHHVNLTMSRYVYYQVSASDSYYHSPSHAHFNWDSARVEEGESSYKKWKAHLSQQQQRMNSPSVIISVTSGEAHVHLFMNIFFQGPSWVRSEERISLGRVANLSALLNLLFFLNLGPVVNNYYFSYYNEYYFSYPFSTSNTFFFFKL